VSDKIALTLIVFNIFFLKLYTSTLNTLLYCMFNLFEKHSSNNDVVEFVTIFWDNPRISNHILSFGMCFHCFGYSTQHLVSSLVSTSPVDVIFWSDKRGSEKSFPSTDGIP